MPQQLINHAMALHRKQDYVAAVALYQQVLTIDSSSVQVWTNLGVALRKLGHYQSALTCQLRARELTPDNCLVLNNLANVYKDVNQLEDSVRCAERACELEPDNHGYWFNLAVNLREAKKYNRALEVLEKCISLDPASKPKYEWEMALCHLYLDNVSAGWRAYRARLETGVLPRREFACAQWMGEPIKGKKIWVVTEQGFGDTFFAARYLRPLVETGAQVIFECKQPLRRLMSCLPVQLVEPEIKRTAGDACDYYVYLMDLPGIFDAQGWPVPPPVELEIPTIVQEKFRHLIPADSGFFNVGIVWSGSETFADNLRRSPGLTHFLQLAGLSRVRLYSLQKGAREKELDQHFARSFIVDLAPHLQDFADTAAAVSQLDLIIMSDSAVAHLAASMGKPVWNLLHSNPYWMYGLTEETSHWYPSMRFIRQARQGDWQSVFDSVIKGLIVLSEEHLSQFIE
jgi:tetratricopeptide (TPR) repeat protein